MIPKATVPVPESVWVAPSMGNHDVDYNNGKSFTDVFVNPPNATDPTERELYYSFDYGNAHFVILNNYFSMTSPGSAPSSGRTDPS